MSIIINSAVIYMIYAATCNASIDSLYNKFIVIAIKMKRDM